MAVAAAVHVAAAAADAYYLLVMAMVVTWIEYVAFEPVVVSTAYKKKESSILFKIDFMSCAMLQIAYIHLDSRWS